MEYRNSLDLVLDPHFLARKLLLEDFSRTASELDCSWDKIAPTAQFYINILLAFLTREFRAYNSDVNVFQKTSPKMSQNQVPRVASLFAKSGFLIDFQDFLKIDVEITQCQ